MEQHPVTDEAVHRQAGHISNRSLHNRAGARSQAVLIALAAVSEVAIPAVAEAVIVAAVDKSDARQFRNER